MGGSVEHMSKELFNSTQLLTVAPAIGASASSVDPRGLQEQLGLRQSAVQRVLAVLEGGLVKRSECSSRTDPIRFVRVSHAFRIAVSEFADA